MIASCGFLENELSQFSKEEGVTLADGVETLGVGLRTRESQEVGSERQRTTWRWVSRSCCVQA